MPALSMLADQVENLVCVYVVDSIWFKPNRWQSLPMGKHRWRFIKESLVELKQTLRSLGTELLVLSCEHESQPERIVKQLCNAFHVSHIGVAEHCGVYEHAATKKLKQWLPDTVFIEESATTLFNEGELPFSNSTNSNMPDNFSPFRRKVEKRNGDCAPAVELIKAPIAAPVKLPHPPSQYHSVVDELRNDVVDIECEHTDEPVDANRFHGGQSQAEKQLEYYLFKSDHIAKYKQTRNGMLGWDYSSKFSAWLAAGNISPRTIHTQLKHYENIVEQNESTYWMFFELLWREFFHWQLKKHGHLFFKFDGIQAKEPSSKFNQQAFQRWCLGNTGYQIVDACMRELNETGFMSNRGRQLVASCFVHELNLDWRYGAAYFEQQLIDFDVASNYGNWQYLAGVGSDPRGHRQFNLNKQTQQYDPDGLFRRKWLT